MVFLILIVPEVISQQPHSWSCNCFNSPLPPHIQEAGPDQDFPLYVSLFFFFIILSSTAWWRKCCQFQFLCFLFQRISWTSKIGCLRLLYRSGGIYFSFFFTDPFAMHCIPPSFSEYTYIHNRDQSIDKMQLCVCKKYWYNWLQRLTIYRSSSYVWKQALLLTKWYWKSVLSGPHCLLPLLE